MIQLTRRHSKTLIHVNPQYIVTVEDGHDSQGELVGAFVTTTFERFHVTDSVSEVLEYIKNANP